MVDTRCVYCNWLNKEVGVSFICKNCGEENNATLVEEVKENISYNSKRRAKQ